MSARATLLFTDVDGTLLDGRGRYAMTAQDLSPFLRTVSIVLASSRTVLELSRNQRDLGIDGPVVAENGAVIALPWSQSTSLPGVREVIDEREWRVVKLGATATSIRDVIRSNAAALQTRYIDQLDIEPALGRECSVLLRPEAGDDFASLDSLAAALISQGYTVASGGSWLAVTHGADKGIGARALIDVLRVAGQSFARVAAVGDGDNDASLLQVADERFVIRGTDGSWHAELLAIPGVRCMLPVGIAGWRDVITTTASPARYPP